MRDTACDVSLGWARGSVVSGLLSQFGFIIGLVNPFVNLLSFNSVTRYSEVGLCPEHVVKKIHKPYS